MLHFLHRQAVGPHDGAVALGGHILQMIEQDAQQRRVGGHAGELLVEAVAGQDFDLLAGETAPGCGLVETSGLSLYGDAFHNRILGIKKSRSLQNGILRVFTLSYHTANCI